IHHLEGHIFAGFGEPDFPKAFIALIASGGHSALYRCNEHNDIKLLGQTLDDAAGEAFDKIGRALGLGYPAGAKIDHLATMGDNKRFNFTIAMEHEAHFNFSFSGLKTKALAYLTHEINSASDKADLCASVQESVAQALSKRAIRACKSEGMNALVLGGGVAANSRLRALLSEQCLENNISLFLPQKRHCVDNAVMIAKAALIRLQKNSFSDLKTDVCATMCIENISKLS
ncbi:MAG TPA: tRNA (adenosine(37)-N6)-threonylcarbamoyltransferase complex transferase subunit TsaD, partial [Myxococcota bacterium]|nr:tRNA (adenosine(37)-N6)-threonylcarbamoyltransferase complex transferase subunit TsaD [Myxococcota bacterium]